MTDNGLSSWMVSSSDPLIREPSMQNTAQYTHCMLRLAFAYVLLLLGALAGVALVDWRAQFFVILAQCSNAETVTPEALLVYFAFPAVPPRGAWGAAGILRRDVSVWIVSDPAEVERHKTVAHLMQCFASASALSAAGDKSHRMWENGRRLDTMANELKGKMMSPAFNAKMVEEFREGAHARQAARTLS